jgi:hypothetical protein
MKNELSKKEKKKPNPTKRNHKINVYKLKHISLQEK